MKTPTIRISNVDLNMLLDLVEPTIIVYHRSKRPLGIVMPMPTSDNIERLVFEMFRIAGVSASGLDTITALTKENKDLRVALRMLYTRGKAGWNNIESCVTADELEAARMALEGEK